MFSNSHALVSRERHLPSLTKVRLFSSTVIMLLSLLGLFVGAILILLGVVPFFIEPNPDSFAKFNHDLLLLGGGTAVILTSTVFFWLGIELKPTES